MVYISECIHCKYWDNVERMEIFNQKLYCKECCKKIEDKK